jgi:hypothetical protein
LGKRTATGLGCDARRFFLRNRVDRINSRWKEPNGTRDTNYGDASAPGYRVDDRVGPPLVVAYDTGSSSRLAAWDYDGHRVGTVVINQDTTDNGCAFAPDGSKVFLDGWIFAINGKQLADVRALNLGGPGTAACSQPGVNGAFFLGGPIWADDSDHVCGFVGSGHLGQGSQLVEVSASGSTRTVTTLPGGGQLLTCSPGADRVLIVQSSGSNPENYRSDVEVIRLSTGALITAYSVSGDLGTATHDGRLIAVSGPTGITVYDAETGRPVAMSCATEIHRRRTVCLTSGTPTCSRGTAPGYWLSRTPLTAPSIPRGSSL